MTAPQEPPGPRLARQVLEPLKRAFVGKDDVVDLLGVALVAGENLFLLGPPGTAKSALVHALGRRLGGRTFDYLLTRFTEPSELFGPFDIRRLREGDLVTNTEGMLPEADLVFLDELLNANSAILNSLLTVLNERAFRRGRETRALPTLAVVGASNHLPEDDALGALYDRFLLRARCDNVPEDRLAEVLEAGWTLEARRDDAPTVSVDEVRALQARLREVDLAEVRAPLAALVRRLRAAGIAVSDRRAVKLQRLVAASALLCGRGAARRSDLWVVRHVWDTEEQVEVLAALVQDALGDAPAAPGDHPRAASAAPDAEALARDLEGLERRMGEAPPTAERAALRDRLGALAARCPWVRDDDQRAALERRVEALWPRLAPDAP
ncbi:MAG: AAA family ATPase [Planctomycetes bacterium]|nr:AAA family ATPase [Planctomycetota bacterium]